MATLGFDTATETLTVAVTDRGDPALERELGPGEDDRPRHSALLLEEVERCVEAAGGWERIDRVGVGVGPGSYTGLRIGIATARALAQGRGLEISGVPTLSALALGMAALPDADGRPLLPVLDARRGQVFAAIHSPGGEPEGEPAVLEPERAAELAAGRDPSPLAAGDGALRFRQELETAGVTVVPAGEAVHRIAARHICALAERTASRPAERIEPIYLREPDAKRWLARDDGSDSN